MTGASSVRAAVVPDEMPVVRMMFAEYASGLGIDLSFQDFDEELANLPGRYAMPDGGIWLGVIDAVVTGCVAIRSLDAGRCEMKRLYLRPAARGTGLGRMLADAAIAGAAERGYERICLDTMPSMINAIALYRSMGFTAIPAYCYNPVEDALFLECRLP